MSALQDALGPVRAALLARARADAEATVRQAEAAAAALLEEARGQAAALVEQARAEGERDAERLRARRAARAHREARETVVRAQQEAYAELRRRARVQVSALRADPAYPEIRAGLRERARAELGADAVVREPAAGGILAESTAGLLDLSLPALADRAVDDLGAEVIGLWTPDA